MIEMDYGFSLVELIVCLLLLTIFLTMAFMAHNWYTDTLKSTTDNIVALGDIRFAAAYINNLLLDCKFLDSESVNIIIEKGIRNSSILRINDISIYIKSDKLIIDHRYPSKDNCLSNNINQFQAINNDGLITVNISGRDGSGRENISITMKVYVGD